VEIRSYGQNLNIRSLDDDTTPAMSYVVFGSGQTIFNPSADNYDFTIYSDTDIALQIDADAEELYSALNKFGFGKTTIEAWHTDYVGLQIGGVGTLWNVAAENDCQLNIGRNMYYDGQFKRMINAPTERYVLGSAFFWYADAAAAPDVGFIPTLRMILTAYDLAEEGAQLGLGTSSPMLNVASAAGDFVGDGIHVKSDIDNNREAFLILEGDAVWTNSLTHAATSIVFADN